MTKILIVDDDLETLRRSVPLHKSDMEYPNLTAKQTQLYGIAFWSPYFGAPVYTNRGVSPLITSVPAVTQSYRAFTSEFLARSICTT